MKFSCLFILLLGSLTAEDRLFVSLGGYCEVATQLRDHELRTKAFPFDWLLTLNHEKFLDILDDDFQFFIDESCIFQHPEDQSILENKQYECEFRHDPPVDLENGLTCHLQEISSKYERRIDRFRQLKEYAGEVFFIRSGSLDGYVYDYPRGGPYYWWNENQRCITTEQAKALKMALDRFFPLLNFTLIIINYTEEREEKIDHIEDVIEFKIRKNFRTLDYSKLLHEIFNRPKPVTK